MTDILEEAKVLKLVREDRDRQKKSREHWIKKTNELEAQVELLTAENRIALAALSELVCLKDLKDRYGKTNQYTERQPEAWKQARAVLSA